MNQQIKEVRKFQVIGQEDVCYDTFVQAEKELLIQKMTARLSSFILKEESPFLVYNIVTDRMEPDWRLLAQWFVEEGAEVLNGV